MRAGSHRFYPSLGTSQESVLETCSRTTLAPAMTIIMLNAICHMFSEEQNRNIFCRLRQALAPNGRLAVQDFILNPETDRAAARCTVLTEHARRHRRRFQLQVKSNMHTG